MISYLRIKKQYINLVAYDQIGSGYNEDVKYFNTNLNKIIERLKSDNTFTNVNEELADKIKDNNSTISSDLLKEFVKASPDGRSYLGWIIKTYITMPSYQFENMITVGRDDLTKYRSLINNKLITDEKDKYFLNINSFRDFDELHEFLKRYDNQLENLKTKKEIQQSKSNQQKKIKEKGEGPENYDVFKETDQVTIYVPKTQDGACYLGKNTKWCTAATSENNMFSHYKKTGELYIIIPKQLDPNYKTEKYQFHFRAGQYMNEQDSPINKVSFFEKYNSIKQWFIDNTLKSEIVGNALCYHPKEIFYYNHLKMDTKWQNLDPAKDDVYILIMGKEKYLYDVKNDTLKDKNDIAINLSEFLTKNVAIRSWRDKIVIENLKKNDPTIKIVKLGPAMFTDRTENIVFDDDFNSPINDIVKISNLKSLKFGNKFNQSLKFVSFPSNLESITFGRDFNQLIDDTTKFSSNAKQIGSVFKEITFGTNFNQSVDGIVFPKSLKSIKFGDRFNKTIIARNLPEGLESLTFGEDFDQDLSDIIYESINLTHLKVGKKFTHSLDLSFNDNFKYLDIPSNYNGDLPDSEFIIIK